MQTIVNHLNIFFLHDMLLQTYLYPCFKIVFNIYNFKYAKNLLHCLM